MHIKKTDITTIHLVVKCIMMLAGASLIAGCVMSWHGDKEASVMILGVTTTTAGGLLGILAKTTVDDMHKQGDATGATSTLTTSADPPSTTLSLTTPGAPATDPAPDDPITTT